MKKKSIEGYINWLNRRHQARKRSAALFLAVSFVLSGNVFWTLRNTGVALADEYTCGLTEHTHSDECYEDQLICSETDPEHVHDENCYKRVLKCGLDEHTHTDSCRPAEVSKKESQSEWESKLPKPVAKKAQSLVNTASSQLDYKEDPDGYTRYGAWYGNPTGDWNVMFVSFCLHYSKISEKDIPYGSGCWAWQVKLDEAGLLIKDFTVMPKMGDLILIDNDRDGKCDLTGIIININDNDISVMEGDIDGVVAVKSYRISDAVLYGYVSVNRLDSDESEPAEETAETTEPADTAETTEETEPAVSEDAGENTESTENTDDVQDGADAPEDPVKNPLEFEAVTGSGITVNASAPYGAFPEGTTMNASDIANSKVKALAEQTVRDGKEIKGMVAVDISFFDAEGNKVEPAEGTTVDISIKIPESRQPEGQTYDLLHIDGQNVSVVEGAEVSSSEAAFTTDGFSIYVVTATGEKDKDKVHAYLDNAVNVNPETDLAGDTIKNSPNFPYVLMEGDTLELIGRIDPADANGENLHIRFYENLNWMGEVVSINETSSTPTEVRATITGISSQPNGGSCAVSLYRGNTDLDQDFSIRVIRRDSETDVIDFDQHNDGDTVYVNYGDTIVFKGTPNRYGEDYDWPYIEGGQDRGLLSAFENASEDAYGVRSVTCRAENYTSGNNTQQVSFWTQNGVMKRINVVVNYDYHNENTDYYEILDHADIEIADGGVYTSVSFELGDDTGMIKTVTEYQSYVSGVNSCRIYDENGNPTPFFETQSDQNWQITNATPLPDNGFDSDDYWSDPRFGPGDSQYELTSKYHDDYITNNKHFRYKDTDHVVFDVSLQIAPTKIEKYKYNSTTGEWEIMAEETVVYTPDYPNRKYTKTVNGVVTVTDGELDDIVERIDSQVFELDKRYVIDAYNKCPNHSGLDFTVHANTATVQFGATKELTNGVLRGGDFTFELVDRNTDKVVTEVNNAEGKVLFERLQFNHPGIYRFYIREKDDHQAGIRYDNSVYDVTVEVTEIPNTGGMLMADVKEFNNNYTFKFTNSVIFSLPNTGGPGIAPFIAAGTLMIGGALILLIKRRCEGGGYAK